MKPMALPDDHEAIEVESYQKAGKVQVRPVAGQKFPASLQVEGNKSLVEDYAVGTRFKVQVSKMARPTGGGEFLFSSWQWDVKVLSQPEPS
jgi:hypothetical protein